MCMVPGKRLTIYQSAKWEKELCWPWGMCLQTVDNEAIVYQQPESTDKGKILFGWPLQNQDINMQSKEMEAEASIVVSQNF